MGLPYDYSVLRGRIREKGMTLGAFANAIGVAESTLHSRLRGLSVFTQAEIDRAVSVLEIPAGDISRYFFTRELRKPVEK